MTSRQRNSMASQKAWRVAWLFVVGGLLLLSASTFGEGKKKKEKPGEKVYKTYCLTCHGDKGKGDGPAGKALKPPPPNFTKGVFKYGCAPSKLAKTIEKGSKGTAMPAWGKTLKAEQIEAVVNYILQTFVPKRKAKECLAKEKEENKEKAKGAEDKRD